VSVGGQLDLIATNLLSSFGLDRDGNELSTVNKV
jgi:hypothetical protein